MAKIYTSTHKFLTVLTKEEVEKDYSELERKYFDGFKHEQHIIEFSVLITKIGANAFKNSKNLIEVIFSDNVTKIGNSAFENCENLKSVNLNKVSSIGESSFKNCNLLKCVDFGNINTVSKNCFENCSNLTDINITNVTTFDKYCFKNCESLTSLVLSNSLKYLDKEAFSGCNDLMLIVNKKFDISDIKDVQINKVSSTDDLSKIYIEEFISAKNLFNQTEILDIPKDLSDTELLKIFAELKKLQQTKNKLNSLIRSFSKQSF